MSIQDAIANEWITWARPTPADADEFFQVEISLNRIPSTDPIADSSCRTTFAFWENVDYGTPWRRTWRWRSSHKLNHELEQLKRQADADMTATTDEPVVRTYSSITRAPSPSGGWVYDAIANDGTAWWRLGDSGNWMPHSPLPQPDQTTD